MNKKTEWSLLMGILVTFPFVLGIVFGAPFQFDSIPPTSQAAILVVWSIWLFSFSIFVMESVAALRGKSFPLLLPAIQRPIARAISNSLIIKMVDGHQENSKRPLTAAPLALVEDESIPEALHRSYLARAVWSAASALDSKLRNRKNPSIIGAGIEADSIKIILDDVMSPPEGFEYPKAGNEEIQNIWEIKASRIKDLPEAGLEDLALPLLIRLGYYDGSNVFYLNMEAVGSLAIRGNHMELLNYQEEMLKELTSDELNFKLKVFCIGMGYESEQSSQVMVAERLSDILPAIEKQFQKIQHPSTIRSIFAKDFSPILILDPFTDNADLIARLESSARGGIAAILGNGTGASVLEITKTQVNLSPLGLQLVRQPGHSSPPGQNGSEIQGLEIMETELFNPLEEPEEAEELETMEATEESEIPEIEMLGAVRVKNVKESFVSLQALSLVCYLSVFRNGATSDQLMRWLWPAEEPPTRSVLANVISRARRSLGGRPDGKPYITFNNGIYRLDEAVKSDYENFLEDVEKSELTKDGNEALMLLSQAVERVKGVPFSVGATQTFQWSENGKRSEMESRIDTAVHKLVDLAIQKNKFNLARSALTKGLICIPGCEQCMARQLIASAKMKNAGALIQTKKDILSAYQSLEYEVPKALLELYEILSKRLQNQKRDYGEMKSI